MDENSSEEKKSPPENKSDTSGVLALAVIAGALATLLLFILRRSLIRLFPVLIVLIVFIPLIFYLYRRHKYRDLEDIYTEYKELAFVLHDRGMHTYLSLIQNSMSNLISLRNKAEHVSDMLAHVSSFEIQEKIEELDREISRETDPQKKEILIRSLKEFEDNARGMEKLTKFLEKYESNKVLIANYFKNIRLKIQMNTLSEAALASVDSQEVDKIIADIDNIQVILHHVDGAPEPAPGPEDPPDQPRQPPPENRAERQ